MNKEHSITRENLLFTFPLAFKEDKSLSALGDATAQLLAAREEETDIPRIFPEIDRLDEAVLDILAYDLKVDWYDYDYPVKAKRELIKSSVLTHMKLGTVYAVKLVLNSLYPKSELEEWFTYGGTPGCFRLNVNVSDSATEGAVAVCSTKEIMRRIATVKRLSAHLEGVSYMVRNAIVVGHRIDCWQYRVPECGTIRCGTWWMRHTLGWSERHRLTTGLLVDPLNISPELTGTLPDIKTPGYSIREALRIEGQTKACLVQSQFAGKVQTGTEWTRHTLGWSEQTDLLAEGARAESFATSPELAGTLPESPQVGYAVACGSIRSGGVIEGFKIEPEYTGTLPREAQHGERDD